MEKARLIIDDAANGAWNMSMDQALLETANSTGLVTLRFYTWSEPTLSLGYFQSHLDRVHHPSSQACPMVRRKTGGGAILHHHELTYSLCVPAQHRWSKQNSDLYRLVHRAIIELLAQDSITAHLFGEVDEPILACHSKDQLPVATIDNRDFMCFKRRAEGDIVLDGHKVVGSAQRRLRNALLQHGSLLLFGSKFASELFGIKDLVSEWPESQLAKKLADVIFGSLGTSYFVGEPSDQEMDASKSVYSSQFDADIWNFGR